MVKIFSSVKRMFSCQFSACHWRRCSVLVCRISLKAGGRRCPFDCQYTLMCRQHPWWGMTSIRPICLALGTRTSVSRADFGESIPVPQSSHSSAVLIEPVFNPPEFLIMFNCLIDEHSWNFQWFQELKNLRIGFSARVITATQFSSKPHSMLTLWQMWANCLGTSTWRYNSPKLTILSTLLPHCLQLQTTRNL